MKFKVTAEHMYSGAPASTKTYEADSKEDMLSKLSTWGFSTASAIIEAAEDDQIAKPLPVKINASRKAASSMCADEDISMDDRFSDGFDIIEGLI